MFVEVGILIIAISWNVGCFPSNDKPESEWEIERNIFKQRFRRTILTQIESKKNLEVVKSKGELNCNDLSDPVMKVGCYAVG